MKLVVFLIILVPLIGAAEAPTISADLGACTADFKVTDAQEKPIYDAKVHVIIRYGFLAKRKTELEAATDANGQVRFTGLPNDPKRDIVFDVHKGNLSQSLPYDPTANCHQHFDVKLGK